jgi:antitoxin ParD1/3/4
MFLLGYLFLKNIGSIKMPSSLHVSLPDEMRAYVDLRTNGENTYSTPSEYVRDLIRRDMEQESQRRYVFSELLKSADDIKHGRLISSDEFEKRSKEFLDNLTKEDE